MTKLAKLAGTLPFAHLLGVKAAKSEADEDDDKDKKKDDTKDDPESKKVEGDDDKPKDDEKKDGKAKKAKGENDDDEDAKASAVVAERARCAAIVAHGVKLAMADDGDLRAVVDAASFAFDTSMSASSAIATLDARAAVGAVLPSKSRGPGLRERMSQEHTELVRPAPEPAAEGSTEAIVAMATAALAKARGEKA